MLKLHSYLSIFSGKFNRCFDRYRRSQEKNTNPSGLEDQPLLLTQPGSHLMIHTHEPHDSNQRQPK